MFSFSKKGQYLALLFLTLLTCMTSVQAQDYEKGWDAIGKNDFKQARASLEKAMSNPATAVDAAMTLIYLETINYKEAQGQAHWKKAQKFMTQPYPYLYAYWFNDAVVGSYGKKTADQKKILEQIVKDPASPSMLKASTWYQMGHSFIVEDKFKNTAEVWAKTINVDKWQFVGPFDNVSGSGFDKSYPPIAQPQSDKGFKSANDANINWFTPTVGKVDGWITPSFNIKWRTAVLYAQSFVSVESDMEATLGFGMTSSAKVWVNDRLVLTEQEPRKTDYDLYQMKVKLKKGGNRILVQLSFEGEDYANFAVRLLDAQGELIPLVCTAEFKPYAKDNTEGLPARIPFFAEKYFEDKIAKEPKNLINYILLIETYLRSAKNQEALAIADKGLAQQPESIVFNYLRLACLSKLGNRTDVSTLLEKLKELDENSMIALQMRYNEEFEKEKYDDAEKLLNKRIQLFGEDESTLEHQIKIAAQKNKIEELIKLVELANTKYPTTFFFARCKYNLTMNLRKDNRAALAVYESFLTRKYEVSVAQIVASEYFKLGMNDKALAIYTKIEGLFSDDTDIKASIFNHYYAQKDNKKAKTYIEKMIGIAPTSSGYWEDAALLANQMGDQPTALVNYKKSLHYNPNDFKVRRTIRELEKKQDLNAVFTQYDYYDLLKKTNSKDKIGKHNWYYVLDDSKTIVYPERNSEAHRTMIIKVLNEKGIETWKERSLGYNRYREKLIVEKAEVVKPNGSKVKAEQNGGELVFPNLEKGDGIIISYRIESYSYGRMAREFWEKNFFNMFVPVEQTRYALLIAKSIPLSIKAHNFTSNPVVKDIEDFKLYTWEMTNLPPVKDETFMQGLSDCGMVLHVSTVPDWKEITTWYGDVSATQAKQDYEIKKLVGTLFPEGKKYSDTEKARIIYEWILKNIRYSSVPFRQSGYVPQLASKVIQTKLGDCKDLATLFAAIAREIGMKANLVLVNTRDNGDMGLLLPSMDFNHCIVKVIADGKPWYLELTDPHLPFGSLPNSDLKATALEIPFNETIESKPFALNPTNRINDSKNVKVNVKVQNRGELTVNMSGVSSGANASNLRSAYLNLPDDECIKKMHNAIADRFTNPVSVKSTNFGNFDGTTDTFHFHTSYVVKNEVIEIGDLKTIKVPFYNFFFKSNAFQEDKRTLDINYWEYEDCDGYTDEVNITLPEGKQFSDIPKDQKFNFNQSYYSLRYIKKSATTLQVIREIKVNRENIPAVQYEPFKSFVDDILAAESKYVSFK
jgi:tetratricopeptide (TPR) repeat protein